MGEHKNLLIVLGEWWASRQKAQAGTPGNPPNRLRDFLRWMVPNGGTILLVLVLILTQQVWARPLQQEVNVPGPSATTVNYQGRLADAAGNPLDGTYGMTFALFATDSGGSPVWGPESHPAVPVSGGLFSVGLGSQTSGGIPTTVWDGDRYLEIAVGGETMSPRELIRSVPIAGMALTVPDGAIGTAQIADGAVTQDKAPALIESWGRSGVLIQYGHRAPVTDTMTHVTFSQPFPGNPTVMATPDATCPIRISVSNMSTTGFDVEVEGVMCNVAINWIAIYPR